MKVEGTIRIKRESKVKKGYLSPFAVIQFDDSECSIEPIRTRWGRFNENGQMFATFFPGTNSGPEIDKLVREDADPDDTWGDENGDPWPILKVCSYADTFQQVMDRLDYEIKLSTVESDDNVNEEKLKKTRHLRAKKDFNSDDYSESDSSEEEIKKTKLKKIFVPSTSQTKSSKINQDGINQERSNYEEINQQRSNQEAINQDKINQEANNHTMPSSNGTAKNHKKRPSSFQNNEDEINACDPSQRIMLKKMNRMGIVLESIQKNINSNFTAGNAFNESSFINKDADLEIFPISNEEDIATIEKKLERKEFKNKIESALRNCGKCATVSMTVNHFMDQVITYKTGMLYSFKGKNEKKKQFKSLQLYTIVANSVFKAYKECTIKNIDLCIGLWLAQCKNRFNRQENARQQLERDSRDMDVDLDSDEMEE